MNVLPWIAAGFEIEQVWPVPLQIREKEQAIHPLLVE